MSGRARVLVGFGGFGLFWGSWGAVLPLVQGHAGVGDGALGVALVWIGVGALISLRVAGTLADRYPRTTLPLSIALLGASTVAPVIAGGQFGLSLACGLVGLCSGAADAAINAAGAHVEASGTAVLNVAHGVFSALVVVASLGVAALVSSSTASPWPLLVVGATLLLAALAATTMPTPAPEPAPWSAPAQTGPPARRRMPRIPVWLLVLGALGAVAYLIENAWQSWAAIHLHSTLHASPALAAAAPAVFAGCATIGRFAGHLAQVHAAPRRMLAAGSSVAAVGSAVAALAPSVSIALLGIALAGLGTSVCAPTLIAAAGRGEPHAPGAATSTVITLAYLGFVLGPAAVGLLAGAATLRTALVAVAIAAAGLALASRVLPNRAA